MGVLLTFMFLGNMVAALALVPALSRLLLDDPRPSAIAALASAGAPAARPGTEAP
jgi:hypothetical protein